MLREYTVYITETTVRPVRVIAETPADAERMAEDNYNSGNLADVKFEADPMYCKPYFKGVDFDVVKPERKRDFNR
jgi:hypothetical protein